MSSSSKDAAGPGFAPAGLWLAGCGVFPDPRCWVAGWDGGRRACWLGWLFGWWLGANFSARFRTSANGSFPFHPPIYRSLAREEEPLLESPGGSAIRRFNLPSSGTCFDSVTSGCDCAASLSVRLSVYDPVGLQLQDPKLHAHRAVGECGGWLGGTLSFYCAHQSRPYRHGSSRSVSSSHKCSTCVWL